MIWNWEFRRRYVTSIFFVWPVLHYNSIILIRYLWSIVVLKEPVICCHKTSIVEERQIFNFYSLRKKNPVMCMVTEGESFHLHHRRVDMQRWKISHPISQKLTRVSVPPHTIGSKPSWNYITIFIRLRFHEIFYKTLIMFCTFFLFGG